MKPAKNFIIAFFVFGFFNYASAQDLTLKTVGTDSLETQIINSIEKKSSFVNYSSLQKELDSILLKLQKRGFLETELLKLNKLNDSVFEVKLSLNNPFDTIYIHVDNLKGINALDSRTYQGDQTVLKVRISEVEDVLKNLNKELANEGDPFISIQLDNIRKRSKNKLEANLKIERTRIRKIDHIIVKGYEKFPESFVKRYLKIKKGQVFNLKDIENKTRQLNNLRFANQIRDPEILFSEDSTAVYLYLQKRPANSFDGFLGFGTSENNSKIKFNGYLNLNLLNNLNYGESLKFIYRSDENEQRTINVNTTLPYLFKSPVGLEFNLNIFKKDSTFNSVNQSLRLFYQLNTKIKILSGIEATNSSNLQGNLSPSSVEDYKALFYTFGTEFEKYTESLMFPIESYALIGVNFGKRENTDKKENQTALTFRAFKIFNLNSKNSIYINSDGRLLFSDNYLTNELYRFGGINSLRGFEENSIFASLYSVINTEYRYLLNNNLYVNSILDAAYYENKIVNTQEKLFAFGFGLGVATNAGILKLNYANGFSENQPFNFRNSKVHISLNAFF